MLVSISEPKLLTEPSAESTLPCSRWLSELDEPSKLQ